MTKFDAHRWLAVPFGVALVLWIVSGLMILSPVTTPDALRPDRRAQIDWASVSMSPADAAAVVRSSGTTTPVRSVRLAALAGRAIYQVTTQDGVVLVDAVEAVVLDSGEPLALEVARWEARPEVGVEGVDLVTEHGPGYMGGPLPAYRIRFATSDGSWVHVEATTGTAQWSDRWGRMKEPIASLHGFSFLQFLGADPVWALLILATLGAAGVATSGYLLAFERYFRKRRISDPAR